VRASLPTNGVGYTDRSDSQAGRIPQLKPLPTKRREIKNPSED
jgi:hypothetical protein